MTTKQQLTSLLEKYLTATIASKLLEKKIGDSSLVFPSQPKGIP